MTIQEAVESGRKFKRPIHGTYSLLQFGWIWLSKEDILANDWEVESTFMEDLRNV